MRWGPGPVFLYECLTSSRRWQAYALRSGFVAALLLAMWAIATSRPATITYGTYRDYANLGRSYFFALIGVELALVMLAAPAATAGSICVDRARGTLAHMLMTDLTDPEIVLGEKGKGQAFQPACQWMHGRAPRLRCLSLLSFLSFFWLTGWTGRRGFLTRELFQLGVDRRETDLDLAHRRPTAAHDHRHEQEHSHHREAEQSGQIHDADDDPNQRWGSSAVRRGWRGSEAR